MFDPIGRDGRLRDGCDCGHTADRPTRARCQPLAGTNRFQEQANEERHERRNNGAAKLLGKIDAVHRPNVAPHAGYRDFADTTSPPAARSAQERIFRANSVLTR